LAPLFVFPLFALPILEFLEDLAGQGEALFGVVVGCDGGDFAVDGVVDELFDEL
jgi:hypothetical protein